MEPSDPAKNEGSSGFSKRRISSILKAPRKSIRLPEPEQQEKVVECAKPVEKRNSRRVSFAPANDVLLFSKDVKNVSPARSPLQELMTTAAADAQNRVQFVLTEDGIQQITGMDTLLNAPLHTTRQRDTVNFDAGVGFGEKTVLFSTDDALMDMTHSHTINIARDEDFLADIPLQNYHILPTGGEKTGISANGGSMDMAVNILSGSATLPTSRNMDLRAEKKNTSSAVSSLDPDFENFLANLSKSSRPIVNPAITRAAPPAGASSGQSNNSLAWIKTQQADVDKENQVPSSVSAVMEKTLNTPSVLYPEDDVSMDMTEAQTGRIQAFTDDDDDPFQCLFPSQEMYSHLGNRASQTAVKTKQQQSRKTLPSSTSTDMTSLRNSSVRASLPGQRVNHDSKDEHREKTIVFTAGDDFMDMTQSHTANIASGSFPPPIKNVDTLQTGRKIDQSLPLKERKTGGSSTNGVDVGFKSFLASLSKPSGPSANPVMVPPTAAASKSFEETFRGDTIRPESDVRMEVQTSHIMGPAVSDDPFQFLLPTKDMHPNSDSLHSAKMTSGQKSSKVQGSFNHAGMGTSLKPSLKTKGQRNQVRVDFEDDCGEKTVRFTADDAAMDVTRSHTVNIATDVIQQPRQPVDYLPACGEKTVRFTANEAAMDETRSYTVNIAASLEPHKKVDSLPTCGEKTLRFTAKDAAMDETRSHTVNIATNLEPELQAKGNLSPTYGEKTVRFTANEAGMDETRSYTVNIAANLVSHKKVDSLPTWGEKTVRFTANDAAMDETRSHTVNIAANLKPEQQQKVDFLPTSGEKTLRFTADDAAMDVTKSHTVNIAANLEPYLQQKVDLLPSGKNTLRLPANEAAMNVRRSHTVNIATNSEIELQQKVDILPSDEKTLRFSANDAAMDVTQCLTVNISTNVEPQLQQKVDFLPTSGEKTLRFETDATMDVTQCHTANIVTNCEPQSHQYVDVLPDFGEKTLTFTADDAAMDVTQCITGNIATNSVLLNKESNILSTQENNDFKSKEIEPCQQRRKRSLTTHTLDPGFKNSLPTARGSSAYTGITKVVSQEAEAPGGVPDQLKTQKNDVDTERVAFDSAIMEKQVNETMTEDDVNMDMTEAQTGNILRQTCTDESPQGFSSTQDMDPDQFRKTEMTFQNNEAPGSSNPDSVNFTNRPDSLDSNESDTWKEHEPRNQTCSLSEKIESSPAAVDHDVDAAPSRKSRRRSIADLQSKLRRLSHLINTAPDAVTMESCTAPLPMPEPSMEKSPKDKTKSLPGMEPELDCEWINANENTQAQCLLQGEQPASTAATPFNLKTKQLMSRLSVGGFKAKLPQRTKPDDSKKVNSVGEHARTTTVNVTAQLSNFDADVSDINDEELGSCEDMSEMIDTRTPQKVFEKSSFSQKSNMEEPLEDDVFEQDFISTVCGNKRPLPVDENNMEEDEKRMKASTETLTDVVEGLQSHVDVAAESDGNMTTAPSMTTQNTDFSNSSHTASRCEATFESTFKHSLFESQLEEYANDLQRKFDDGSITVLEFFKLFNFDFVIHNPRQSVLPGRLLSDTDRTPMDLLKDRHINRPKQMVYETNVRDLTERVEELKGRMRDLDKPLQLVNRALWEEMRNVSEKELKSFGAKLKERNNLFRKTSKVKSHEMKEALYSQLVRANLEEQQKLRGRIEKADEMIQSLDDCIHELETEMSAVEEKGTDDTPSLRSIQEELQAVTHTLADKDRQTTELEMQNTQNSSKLNRLIAETRNLESHVDVLKTLNEWKFGGRRDDCTVYTFLHDTFHLELLYDKSNEDEAQNPSERKISHIAFNLHLDDEKSHDHARLVHKLLSQYVEGETSWVEKYPTSRHVPKLLHDVSLVVSHCRLLGEELRLLKMWGGLRLDIVDISCVDTQVHIVFSSLKRFSKFEVIFSVSLNNQLCVLGVQSFKNLIGSTTIEQIEEIVASFSPTRKLLTKIVKKIHEKLLC